MHYDFLDVAKEDSVAAFARRVPQEFRSIDVLVNNAGLAAGFAPLLEYDNVRRSRSLR